MSEDSHFNKRLFKLKKDDAEHISDNSLNGLDGKIKIYLSDDPTDCNDKKEGYYQRDLKSYIILLGV
jgi:hypothetical protein